MVKLYRRFNVFFDNAGGDGGTGAEGENKENKDGQNRVYTQAELEEKISAERLRAQELVRKQTLELEQLKKSKGLSEEEKKSLTQRIDALNSEFMTKEQLLKAEKEKTEQTYQQQLEALQKKLNHTEKLFTESTIARELTDAAVASGGQDPEVFLALLRPKTQLVEERDENDVVVRHTVKVKHNKTEKDGTVVELDLTPKQVLDMMKEDVPKYGFLFKNNAGSGVGGSGSKRDNNLSVKNMTTEQYMEYRKQQKGH